MTAALRIVTALTLICLPALILVRTAWADPAPASTSASAPASAPAAKEVLAKVGDTEITSQQVEDVIKTIKDLPPDKRPVAKQKITEMLVVQTTIQKFVQKEKMQCTPEEITDFSKRQFGQEAEAAKTTIAQLTKDRGISQESIRVQTCLEKIFKESCTKEKAEQFLKSNPDYFNGTQMRASHILITCPPFSPTELQQAAVKKLEGLATDIKAGKITFEDAAKKESSCPSKEKGGDLDFFTYDRMVPSFATAAFAAKKGELTGIVRSKFGFHLIKVTDRKDGKDQPAPEAQELAKQVLQNRVENRIIDMALTDGKIEIK